MTKTSIKCAFCGCILLATIVGEQIIASYCENCDVYETHTQHTPEERKDARIFQLTASGLSATTSIGTFENDNIDK